MKVFSTEADISRTVYELIKDILASEHRDALFSPETPLMNLGFTSVDLMELRNQLIKTFKTSLHATFFFQYSSAEAISKYFIELIFYPHHDWLYTIEVEPLLPSNKKPLPKNGLWIIFCDKNEIFSTSICKALQAQGQQVITINAGAEFIENNPNHYTVCPTEMMDYKKILDDLPTHKIEGIIYLWGIEHELPEQINIAFLKKQHKFNCEGLLMLLKSLNSLLLQKMPHLWIINEYSQKPGSSELLVNGPLTWLAGAIFTEHPELNCHHLSLEKETPLEENIEHCIEAFKSEQLNEQVIWCSGTPCAQRLVRFNRPKAQQPVVLNPNATYLITGGCGGLGSLGLYAARWHAEHGAKNLLMLDAVEVSPQSAKYIKSICDQGVHVDLEIIDITKKEELDRVLKTASQAGKPIMGITHTIDILDKEVRLIDLDWSNFEKVMQYKREVAWHLHELSIELGLNLDHFLFFSSIGSIVGQLWHSPHSAANGFIAALSNYRRTQGLPALAIDWGSWQHLIKASRNQTAIDMTEGLNALNVRDAMTLLTNAYHCHLPEIVAANIDWGSFLKRSSSVHPLFSHLLSEYGLSQSEMILQLNNQNEEAQNKILQNYLKQHVKHLLRKPVYVSIESNKNLDELGMDDLGLLELKNCITLELGNNIVLPQILFQTKITIETLAESLLSYIKNETSFISEQSTKTSDEPIAVIGMACRLPGAKNYQEFWSNLVNEVDSISEIPKNRWDWEALYGDPKTQLGKTNIKWGGFIEGVDEFDPLFFNIAPKEAIYMDPQHRLFLQTAWHAMEDAGYSSSMLNGKKVGVYAGVSKNDYAELMREQHGEIVPYISTGSVHSILTNRVSYFLDLHGPSESTDTACSSSLVALHSALSDIRSGACHMAFVGGVNALLSPTMYISHSRSGFLAEDGRCKSFDAGANGYVRSEGVVVLLLKPLKKALEDRDAIHAVIRSAAVNHGGKSSGLTAPNISAQAEVIRQALEEANMDPNDITYIEVHGTGTPLGDPVEIEALKQAFSEVTKKYPGKQPCLLGAVKTNIGHCESVSGMAGIVKTIMAMKHQQIPANLHFKSLNPNIKLENSPFRLATKLQPWTAKDGAEQSIKRCSGVSSFGMGGCNAHVILEEAPKQVRTVESTGLYLIPVSAKKGRLDTAAMALAHYLNSQVDPINIEALAFTLQTGRDHFEERVAFIVDSVSMLSQLLTHFLAHEEHENIYHSGTKITSSNPDTLKLNLINAAAHWIKGEVVDWFWYWNTIPLRLQGLPGYPFIPKRYWFKSQEDSVPDLTSTHMKTGIQPQLMRPIPATSIGYVIRASEPFLKDHIIAGQSIMPGVMYLELARATAAQLNPQHVVHAITQVSWIAPIKVIAEEIRIIIHLKGEQLTEFQIMEGTEICATGSLIYEAVENPKPIDLKEKMALCPNHMDSKTIYEQMQAQGLKQGPSLRVLSDFYSGHQTAIAKIHLNDIDSLNDFLLHPSLMDGVFQTVVAHHFSEHDNSKQQYLPTMLESVAWFKPLEEDGYVYIEELPRLGSGKLLKYRMSLLDSFGKVIVQFEGFHRRPLNQQQEQSINIGLQDKPYDFYYSDFWEEQPALANRTLGKQILLFSENAPLKDALSARLNRHSIIWVKKGIFYSQNNEVSYEINPNSPDDFLSLFEALKAQNLMISELIYSWELMDLRTILYMTQALMRSHCFNNLVLLYLYETSKPSNGHEAEHAMFAGFGRTLIYENPQMQWRNVEIEALSLAEQTDIIICELKSSHTSPLLETSYVSGARRVRRISEARDVSQFVAEKSIFKTQGIYLITGGAGGLGRIIAHYLAMHYQAHLILVGRSELNDSIQQFINELSKIACSVHYLSADLTQSSALARAFDILPESLKQLNGVIHAAGLKQDTFILKKDFSSFNQIITTKVRGTHSLDELTKNMPIDFMLLFSSIAALIPNQGQSDYATANSYLDRFAQQRNELVQAGQRHGVSLTINWPLWASGGMKVSEKQEEYLYEEFGMMPLPTKDGLYALEHMLSFAQAEPFKHHQIIVISGDKAKIQAAFDGIKPEAELPAAQVEQYTSEVVQMPVAIQETSDDLETYLKETIAHILHIDAEALDPSMDFERYGINSIVIIEINTILSKRFPGLPKTLFFEYPNLNELLEYLNSIAKPDDIALKSPKASTRTDTPSGSPQSTQVYTLVDSMDLDSTGNEIVIKKFRASEHYLTGFSYRGKPAIPGAFFLEMARQGASILHPTQYYISIFNNYWPIALENANEEVVVRAKFLKHTEPLEFEISSIDLQQQEIIHATGSLATKHRLQKPAGINLFEKISAAQHVLDSELFYNTIHHNSDLRLGGVFRPVQSLHILQGEAIASLVLDNQEQCKTEQFMINPILFTGLEQSLLVLTALTHAQFYPQGMKLMPVSIDSVDLYESFPCRCFVYIKAKKEPSANNKTQVFDMSLYSETGEIIAYITGNSMRIIGVHTLEK